MEGKDAAQDGAGIFIEETEDAVVVSVIGDDQKVTGGLKVRMESFAWKA
jgi:predicted RNA-binding protein